MMSWKEIELATFEVVKALSMPDWGGSFIAGATGKLVESGCLGNKSPVKMSGRQALCRHREACGR